MRGLSCAKVVAVAGLLLLCVGPAPADIVGIGGFSTSGTANVAGTFAQMPGSVTTSTIQFGGAPPNTRSIEVMPETMHKVAGIMVGAGILLFVFLGILAILASIFWIWMLVDCAMNPGLTDIQKIIWVLIVLFTHLLGAIIYYFVARPKRGVMS